MMSLRVISISAVVESVLGPVGVGAVDVEVTPAFEEEEPFFPNMSLKPPSIPINGFAGEVDFAVEGLRFGPPGRACGTGPIDVDPPGTGFCSGERK